MTYVSALPGAPLSTVHAALVVKVCGLRTPEHMRWVRQSGATLAGLVFAPSRRQVTVAEAQAILAGCRVSEVDGAATAALHVAGVFADQDEDEVAGIAAACRLDVVQLSGHEPAGVTAALVQRGLRVVKAVHVAEGATADAVLQTMAPHVAAGASAILLDTASRQGGGSGRPFDWQVARAVVAQSAAPVILAGGLTPHNVGRAVQTVRPFGVDVSSGVETDGAKDHTKIVAFLQAAIASVTAVPSDQAAP